MTPVQHRKCGFAAQVPWVLAFAKMTVLKLAEEDSVN
jgi:hypothetical protein